MWHYVTYAIVDAATLGQVGVGSIEWEFNTLPRSADEAAHLGNEITALSLERGTFRTGTRAIVMGWSPLGGQ